MESTKSTLSGRLTSLTIYNGRWGRGFLRQRTDEYVTVVGEALVGLREGSDYRFTGALAKHPKFGVQYEVASAMEQVEAQPAALVRHLERNFKRCGKKTAQTIVAHYEARDELGILSHLLVHNPSAIPFLEITGRPGIAPLNDAHRSESIYRKLSTELLIDGVGVKTLMALAHWLQPSVEDAPNPAEAAWTVFKANPYAAIGEVHQFGFAVADKIARFLRIPAGAPERLSALAYYALDLGCQQQGHTFLTHAAFATTILRVDLSVDPLLTIQTAIERGMPIVADENRYYPAHLYQAEVELTDLLVARVALRAPPLLSKEAAEVEHEIRVAERMVGDDFTLDGSQRAALAGLLSSESLIHTLTAGPGCGKTALMELMMSIIRRRKTLFCTPTGKAAKVLSARIQRFGARAYTIHSALVPSEEGGFVHHAGNKLDCEICVVDESSMLDLPIMRALLDALPETCHIIFLGDRDQLPSVSPGQVLTDLLRLPFDHHRLTQTHRNGGGILDVVMQIKNGKCDCTARPDVTFSHGLPEADAAGVAAIARAYAEAVDAVGIANVCLMTSRRRGDKTKPGWNSSFLNLYLRDIFNPDGEPISGVNLRVGDRIAIRVNAKVSQGEDEKGEEQFEYVVNGDSGSILERHVDSEGAVSYLMLSLDDGRLIRYPAGLNGAALDSLDLAFANTVHFSQGSEYARVFFICTPGGASFMHRGVVYTAASRAKQKLHIIGDDTTINSIVSRSIPARNSFLITRFNRKIESLMKE